MKTIRQVRSFIVRQYGSALGARRRGVGSSPYARTTPRRGNAIFGRAPRCLITLASPPLLLRAQTLAASKVGSSEKDPEGARAVRSAPGFALR